MLSYESLLLQILGTKNRIKHTLLAAEILVICVTVNLSDMGSTENPGAIVHMLEMTT
jgi:hypothetical protein